MDQKIIENSDFPVLKKSENPFKGAKSYEEGDSFNFYGRNEEISTLFQLIRLNVLTIFYSQSGIGKSSLLRAGLMPNLRSSDYLPIYLRPNYGKTDLNFSEFIVDQISVSIDKMKLTSGHSEYGYSYNRIDEGESLFEYFHRAPFLKYTPNKDNPKIADINHLTPVLIFDQFEEIFTIGSGNGTLYSFFKDELSYLVENNLPPALKGKIGEKDNIDEIESKLIEYSTNVPNYRVVFALREEFLSNLESISAEIPSVFYTTSRFRLLPFTKKTAEEVILKISDFAFNSTMSLNVINLISDEPNTENIRRRKKNEVEPFLLSLVCAHLYPLIVQGDVETIDSIANQDYGIVDRILNSYYEDSLTGMPEKVRVFIEEELLTDKGNRTLHNNEDAEKIIGKENVDKLVDEFRLLRKEEFLDSQHLEIIHDRITPIIIKSRHLRRENEKALEQKKENEKLAEEHERGNERVLHELEKKKAADYENKVKELEETLMRVNDEKLLEEKEKTIKSLNEKFLEEEILLKLHYSETIDKLNVEKQNELANLEKANKAKINDLNMQIFDLTTSYENKITALEVRRDVEVEQAVKEIKIRLESDNQRLSNDLEKITVNFESLKERYDHHDKNSFYEISELSSKVKQRTLYFQLATGAFLLLLAFFIVYFISYRASITRSEVLVSRADSLYRLYTTERIEVKSLTARDSTLTIENRKYLQSLDSLMRINLGLNQQVILSKKTVATSPSEVSASYQMVTALKVDALALMDKSTEDYSLHLSDVAALQLEINKAIEYDKNRPNTAITNNIWNLINDPDGHLLGGFLVKWKKDGKESQVFVTNMKKIIGESFDQLAKLELKK